MRGSNSAGKAIFSTCLAKEISKRKNRTLLIDFDILNNHIYHLLDVDKTKIITPNINEKIIKKDKYLDILIGSSIIFNNNEKISIEELEKTLENLNKIYKYIIINSSLESFFEFTQKIFKKSNNIFFLIEKTIIDIKKSQNLLKIYLKNWQINSEKFEIILNETTKKILNIKGINKKIYQIKIIENIKYNEKKELLLNEKNSYIEYKKNEYEKIIEKIEK